MAIVVVVVIVVGCVVMCTNRCGDWIMQIVLADTLDDFDCLSGKASLELTSMLCRAREAANSPRAINKLSMMPSTDGIHAPSAAFIHGNTYE